MNTRCILENPIWKKSHWKLRPMLRSFFFSDENANTKKGVLTMELPMTVALMAATKSSSSSIILLNLTPRCFAQLWNKYNAERMEPPSPPSGPIFNIT
jgi:hypothetical protein